MTLVSTDLMPSRTPYEEELRERLAQAEKERDQLGAMCAAYEEKFKLQREIVCAAQDWRKADETSGYMGTGRLDALADAVDALAEWTKGREREQGGA